jgi:hypothetical protein
MKRKSGHICKCDWCVETRSLATEFDTYIASTPLQKRMKTVIESIQAKYGDDDGDEDVIIFSSRK